ncbi:MAG: acyl-CoA dehydrogenase family protein [Actinobacteria bacterium]|nr:acyl-CoA dehydrogenase family protein [Actinomycetota bacterium]
MSFAPSAEVLDLAERTRAFVEDELNPIEQKFLLEGRLDFTERAKLEVKARDRGLWALEAPTEYGGCGYGQVALAFAAEELYKSPIMFGPLPGDIFGGSPEPALYLCTDKQKEKYFHPIISGEKHSAYAFTEPETGSDVAGITTTATKTEDGWVINGTKKFIGWIEYADFLMVFASTKPDAGARGVSCFLVDVDAPGFEKVRQLPTMGDQWAPWELRFADCHVPEENLLGQLHGGFKVADEQLTHGRLKIAALQLGLAQRSIDIATKYAKDRETWGKPIASRQAIQFMLADSEVEVQAARLLVHKAAWMADANEPMRTEAFTAKLYAAEMAQRVTDRCLQILGGSGYLRESPVQSLYRQARVWRIGHGTSEIHRWMIARSMLGLKSTD